MSRTLLSRCALVVTENDAAGELPGASIVVEDGWITYVGPTPPAGEFGDEIDCSRLVAIPGLINTHHHLYQTLTRGFPESEGRALFPWLQMLYPIWAGLDEEMIFDSTRTGLAELALSGCTTSSDHLYLFPPGSERFLDASIEAAAAIGLRFHPTRGSMDQGESAGGLPPDSVVQSPDVILADCERVVAAYHDPSPGAMVRVGLAPCSPFSVSPQLMRDSADLARSLGVLLHTHLAETLDEERYSRETFGVGPVGLLDRVGWLSGDVWLAHCVHLDEPAIDLFARRGVSVAHCPTSNMLLGSGLAPVPNLLERGVPVGLGVDGSASNDSGDLRQEVKQSMLSARVRDGAGALSARQALRLATRGGAECLGRDDIGVIAPGKAADIALFDVGTLHSAGSETDLVAAVVLCRAPLDTVMVHGRVIVRGGALLTADADDITARHRASARRLLNSAGMS